MLWTIPSGIFNYNTVLVTILASTAINTLGIAFTLR